jgi:hypothetical protein
VPQRPDPDSLRRNVQRFALTVGLGATRLSSEASPWSCTSHAVERIPSRVHTLTHTPNARAPADPFRGTRALNELERGRPPAGDPSSRPVPGGAPGGHSCAGVRARGCCEDVATRPRTRLPMRSCGVSAGPSNRQSSGPCGAGSTSSQLSTTSSTTPSEGHGDANPTRRAQPESP